MKKNFCIGYYGKNLILQNFLWIYLLNKYKKIEQKEANLNKIFINNEKI
jgi:hypothetical protein